MMKQLERHYDLGFKWVEIGQTDGCVACQWASCKALAGDDQGEALWIVFRKLAEAMKIRRPDGKIVFLAYGPTKHPPKTFTSFPDNVIIEMCRYSAAAFDEWRPFNVPKLTYIYNWGPYHATIFCPERSPALLAKQLRLFAENNVQGILKCGFGEALGLEGPAN
jgi:hypothetical protein